MLQHKIKIDRKNVEGDMPPPARGCLPNGRRGSPEHFAVDFLYLLKLSGCNVIQYLDKVLHIIPSDVVGLQEL